MQHAAEIFEAGQKHHRAGQLPSAEAAYRRVLEIDPSHAAAMQHLAMVLLRRGEAQQAADWAQRAIQVDPARAEYYPLLAEAQRRLGRVDDAIAAYRQAIALAPDFADAHSNLGTLLQAQGDLDAASRCYRQAIAARGDFALAHHNLAIVLQLQGDLPGAVEHFREAARLNPAALESVLALGYVLIAQGKHDDALRFFQDAVAKHPNSAAALGGLGYALQSAGQPGEAINPYRRAVELAPNDAAAHYNLATALRNLNQPRDALAVMRESLRLDPTSVPARIGAAGVLLELEHVDEAVAEARRAVELSPKSHAAIAQLAAALHSQGNLDEAIRMNRLSIEINPHDEGGHSNLIYGMLAHESCDAQSVFDEHRAWGRRHADSLRPPNLRHDNDRTADRPLRIGYVSAHFRKHAVSLFSEPMIAAHDYDGFEVTCYSDVRQPDEITNRFRGYADRWRDTAVMSDEALARRVRDDRIDILVDLAGHIGGNRLLAFARKPAPIQVSYLGYQHTTGMEAMDYRLTDDHADPPGMTDPHYTERLVRLPRSFFCYAPPDEAPPVNELPALTSGRVTFASLNQPIKIRPHTWETWARILTAIPGARLLVLARGSAEFERVARQMIARVGVDSQRVEFLRRRPRDQYLELHHEIDIALDTFPFNGHTTVCDALWMGVPSIMMEGSSYASRFGGSALHSLGFEELIGRTPEQYTQIAVGLAGKLETLAEWRRTMRDRLRGSPLLDAAGFTRNLEEAYRTMWRDWCRPA